MELFTTHVIKALEPGPHVVFIAGVHGDEYEPMLATEQLQHLLPNELRKGTVTLVGVANQSAFLRSARCGEDLLDLARTCPGKPDGSLTERVASDLSKLIETADYLIDLHTGGVMFDIAPLAGYMLHPDKTILARQRKMAWACGLPIVWGTEPTPKGRTLSVARDAGIPAIYLEYGGGTGIRTQVVTAYQQACLNVLALLGLVTATYSPQPESVVFWVEDYRDHSGYLQAMMPSPIDGIFVGEVSPGGFVKQGIAGEKSSISLMEPRPMYFVIKTEWRFCAGNW
ncbi:succinylglutamate desuccinylase [Spirosoma sp. HMF3257]|uniref:Succinylglutamate desuccinylase n=1 Tax=Spirosoma telluris TaxID=2183553 RepID=A0A327NKL2_9BACT|nr:succinylglutamate desuccinylase [Spirosoma telluris]RAI75343.1 succinylglutamate desuccinylase [Spirosoma telluris]